MKKNMNIKELAKKLNLSITTVSRGLANYSDVSEKTKKRIKKFAEKYNYNPNPYAANLASRSSKNLGFILPLYGLNSSPLNQISFIQFLSGMYSNLSKNNIQLSMLMARSQNEEKSLYEKLIVEQKVRNIIINNLRINDSRIPLLKKNKVNFVAWGRTQNLKNYSWVDLDNHKSMQIIFDHLIKKNHEKIAFININKKFNFAYQRMKTYFSEIKKYKISFDKNLYIEIPKNDSLLSEEVTRKLLKNKKVSAIICCTEYIAAGAIRACNDLKIKIGHDISLITYDSLIVSNLITPKITSISHPTEDLGYNAVKLLMSKNSNDSKNNFYMAKPTIIDRDSVKKL